MYGVSGEQFDSLTASPFTPEPTWTGAAKVDKSKQGQIDRLQEYAYSKYLESQGIDPDIAKSIASKTNSNVKAKKAKKEERTSAIESTAQTALAITGAVLSGGAGAVGMGNLIAELSVQGANIALSTAIGSRKGGAQGAAAGLLNGLVSSVVPLKYNDLPVALNISFDKKNGWGGGLAIGGNSMNGSIQVSQRGGAQIEVGSKIGSVNYNTANGTYGANVSVTGLLNAGKEPLLPAEFTQGLFKNIGANIGWNSRTGASASISYNVNNPDTNKPITGLGLNVDRQGSHLTGNVEGTNLFTSSSDGSFQINTNFANERLTNNAVNEAQDAFDKEMNRRETVAADTALRDAKPPLPPPYNVDPSEMTPELREKALKLLGNRMGKDNKAAETSRTSYLDHLVGGVTDGFQNLGTALGFSRNQVSGTTGFVDEYGNFHPRTCFTKGTLVKTIDGFKVIEEIKAGDIVYSWDEETNSYSYKKVVNTFIRQADKIYTLTYIDGTKLETTWNHPFWIVSKDGSHGDWVQAKDLKSWDLSFTANGQTLLLASIKVEDREETVYNFEVEEHHTYFVGNSGVLVHNDSYTPNPTSGGSETLIKLVERYNKENGTSYSVAEIRALNGITAATGSSTPLPLGGAINFPDDPNPFSMVYNRMQATGLNTFENILNDGMMKGVSDGLRYIEPGFTGILDSYQKLWKLTDDWADPAKGGIGMALGRIGTMALVAPLAYTWHLATNTAAMVTGTVFQHTSPIDYTWGGVGTAIGLGFGAAQIVAGNKVTVKNGVAIFEQSNLMPENTGVSFGPVLSGGKNFSNWRHEFGHTEQNRVVSPLGYLVIMAASGYSVATSTSAAHHTFWTEKFADYWGNEEYDRRENSQYGNPNP